MSILGALEGNSAVIGGALPNTGFSHPFRRASDYAPAPFERLEGPASLALDNVESLMTMFGRIGFGYLVLDERMKIIKWNDPARITLEVKTSVTDEAKAITSAFRQLTERVACGFAVGTVCWVVIPYKGGTPVIVHDDAIVGSNGVCIVMLLSRETSSQPNPARLQQMFGLTSAEVHLAISLASGKTPLEIARSSNLSRTTIRSHLAALFSKTDTNRQSELVALLNQVSMLP